MAGGVLCFAGRLVALVLWAVMWGAINAGRVVDCAIYGGCNRAVIYKAR
jgi:hypothetical protein